MPIPQLIVHHLVTTDDLHDGRAIEFHHDIDIANVIVSHRGGTYKLVPHDYDDSPAAVNDDAARNELVYQWAVAEANYHANGATTAARKRHHAARDALLDYDARHGAADAAGDQVT